MADVEQPSWPEIIRRALDRRLATVHTAAVGSVVSYDEANETVNVQLGTQAPAESGDGFEDVPPLEDVPVIWPGGGSGGLTFPLAAGDRVIVVFSETDFGPWLDTGEPAPPEFDRRHGLYGAAIPWFVPGSAKDAGGPVLSGDPVKLGDETASDFVALASLVTDNLNALKDAIANAVPIAQDGGVGLQNTILAALADWPTDLAATKVQAK